MKREKVVSYGGLAGAVLSCYLLTFYHWLTAPQMMNDGMYGIVFIFSCPPGWFVGSSIAGFLSRSKPADIPYSSDGNIIAGTLACIVAGPFIGMFALMPIGFVIEGLKLLR
jgi:hypothetical protein